MTVVAICAVVTMAATSDRAEGDPGGQSAPTERVQRDAESIVFKGLPFYRVQAYPDSTVGEVINSTLSKDQFKLLIAQRGSDYIWTSRQDRPLIPVQKGAYVHMLSPGTGYIKITKVSELLRSVDMMIKLGVAQEADRERLSREFLFDQNYLSEQALDSEWVYFEMIMKGMMVIIYYGVAEEFEFPYEPVIMPGE